MRLLLLCCFIWCLSSPSTAQTTKAYPVQISLYNNATLLPGSAELGIFGWPIHPGLRVGMLFPFQAGEKGQWYQTAQLAYHYHRYVNHSIHLYSETGYQYHLNSKWDLEGRLGLGYLQAISDTPIFKLKDGIYERSDAWGRAQFTAGVTIGLGYSLPLDWRIFIQSQFYVQAPFVKEYVPILPNLAFHTGIQFPIILKKKS